MAVIFHSIFQGTDGATTAEDGTGRHTMSFQNSAQIDTSQFKFGDSSLLLARATSDHVVVPDSDDWLFTGAFTIAVWHRQFATPSAVENYMLTSQNLSGNNRHHLLYIKDDDELRSNVYYNSGASAHDANAVSAGMNNQDVWNHSVLERDDSDKIRLYRDGVMVASKIAAAGSFNATADFLIGANGVGVNTHDGWIGEVYVNNGEALYGSDGGYTIPTEPLFSAVSGDIHLPIKFLKKF